MIVRVTPHVAPPPLPRQRAPEPVVCELLDDAQRPSVHRVRVVNYHERASNGHGGQMPVDRPASRVIVRSLPGAPVRRVTAVHIEHVRSMIARSTRAAASAGVYGSARMCFGALDLYVSPYHRVEGAPTSLT
jgi:hypothetical protein